MTDVTTGGRCPTEALRATAVRPMDFSAGWNSLDYPPDGFSFAVGT